MKHRNVFEALADTTPQADSAFQRQLEEELIAKMQTSTHDNPNGQHGRSPIQSTTRPALRLPFTLAAAMLLVILVGSVLFSRGKESPSNLSLIIEGSPTPTPTTHIEIAQGATSAPIDPVFLTATAFVVQATQTAAPVLVTSESEICRAKVFAANGARLRAEPTTASTLLAELPDSTQLFIFGWTQQAGSTLVWLQARVVQSSGTIVEGWIRSDFVAEVTPCPPYPIRNTLDTRSVIAPNGTVLSPVVVALQDIPPGTQISEDMLTVVYWPVDSAPIDSFPDISPLVGTIAQTDTARYQPYIINSLSYIIPPGKVVVAVPIAQMEAVVDSIVTGDVVEVWATLLFVDAADGKLLLDIGTEMIEVNRTDTPGNQFVLTLTPDTTQGIREVTYRVIENATVVQVGVYADSSTNNIITLAISPDEAVTLVWLIEANAPITLRKNE